ncbi:MAG: phosphomannomutase/phosphoglucomutase [Nitrososphaerota archaeon]
MVDIPDSIFKAYDIRGIYPEELNEEIAYRIGHAYSQLTGGGRILLGRDVRLSSPALAKSIAKGLIDAGAEVYDSGIVPTPVLYLGVVENRFDGGIQVTASHNPPEWNGFKLVLADGETISFGSGMEKLKELVMRIKVKKQSNSIDYIKKIDIISPYIDKIKRLVSLKRRVRIAVDFSNGASCIVGKTLLKEIGCEVISINDNPDGTFPGHVPEPNVETLKDLSRLVSENNFELGAGIDGDGDRAVILDDRGRILDGDIALAILVLKSEIKGRVVFDIGSSSLVEKIILERGCEPVISRVGRAYMLKRVREVNAVIGAEKSNHIYFSELYGFDDGLYAVAKFAELLSRSEEPLSKILDSIPRYYSSPILTIDVPESFKAKVMEGVSQTMKKMAERIINIDGIKAYLSDGWLLIRPSNTMPQIKYSAEAKDSLTLKRYLDLAESLIRQVLNDILKEEAK